jgi:hypothetical protein
MKLPLFLLGNYTVQLHSCIYQVSLKKLMW